MPDEPTFAELLKHYMAEMGFNGWGPDRLASATGIHRSTIVGWRKGRVPRDWQEVLRLARTLGRDVDSTDALLKAANHPSLAQFKRLQNLGPEEQQLLAFWDTAQTKLPAPEEATSAAYVTVAPPPLPAASLLSPGWLMVAGLASVLVLLGGLLVVLMARDQPLSARVTDATTAPLVTAWLMYTDRQGTNLDQVTFYWDPAYGNHTIFLCRDMYPRDRLLDHLARTPPKPKGLGSVSSRWAQWLRCVPRRREGDADR